MLIIVALKVQRNVKVVILMATCVKGYEVEMPGETAEETRKIWTCSSCARSIRGRYRMKKLETNVDFSCAMGKGLHSFPLYHSSLFSFFLSNFLLVASVIIATPWNMAGHYIFALWFLSSFFFFSSPNLSGWRLDVCHTSTHGVALVQI